MSSTTVCIARPYESSTISADDDHGLTAPRATPEGTSPGVKTAIAFLNRLSHIRLVRGSTVLLATDSHCNSDNSNRRSRLKRLKRLTRLTQTDF